MKERFAKIDIVVSEPLVPFKESIVPEKSINYDEESQLPIGTVEKSAQDGNFKLRLRILPLPKMVQEYLLNTRFPMKDGQKAYIKGLKEALAAGVRQHEYAILDFNWENLVDNIIAFGPKSVGPNIFVNQTKIAAPL